jgi:hypothetical protein
VYPADMLFQGAFGEMHNRDKSADPVKIAQGIGFRGSRWKTLETGCGNEIDYHFLDPTTAAFGLSSRWLGADSGRGVANGSILVVSL